MVKINKCSYYNTYSGERLRGDALAMFIDTFLIFSSKKVGGGEAESHQECPDYPGTGAWAASNDLTAPCHTGCVPVFAEDVTFVFAKGEP